MKKTVKKNLKQDQEITTPLFDTILSALKIIFIAGTITLLFKNFYYEIFPWVLSKNVVFPAWEIAPWMLNWTRERDGIEIYVLYTLVLAIIGTSTLLTNFLVKTKLTRIQNCLMLVLFFIPSCWLFLDSSFAPPAKIPSSDLSSPLLLYTDFARVFYSALIGISVLILVYIQTKLSDSKEFILAAILSIPFLFIATTPVAISNYSYLFAPAQKMLNGISISEIYFQYDFLISAIAAMWMTAGFDLNWFHVLGQASNYIAILAVFCMAKKLFELKSLPLLLFISLILIKVASAPWDPVFVFQITALRLDLWLVPFIVIYHWGPLHRITVFTFGILVLIHGSFGLIYTIGYIQLLLTLSFFSIRDVGIKDFFKRYSNARTSFVIKLAFLLACFVLSRIIFGKSMMATSWYQKIGIGFMPLVSWSFYWIYPVVIASASALLLLMRNSLPAKYLIQATALIYFTTGNCIYFFWSKR